MFYRCQTNGDDSKNISYTGTDPKVCQITVYSVTDADNLTYAARLDIGVELYSIPVTIAKNIDYAKISIGPNGEGVLNAGDDGEVKCKIHGGRPAPLISFGVKGMSKAQIINDSQVQTPDNDGIYDTVEVHFVNPTPEDHGRNVTCTAAVYDGDLTKALFTPVEAEMMTLNVTFQPQPMANQTVKCTRGQEWNVDFVFKANPEPTTINWVILTPIRGMDRQEVVEKEFEEQLIAPGEYTFKYNASDVMAEDESKYKVSLTIMDASASDERKSYRLDVSNSIGSQSYYYKVSLKGSKNGGTEEPTTKPPGGGDGVTEGGISNAGLVFIILLAICVVAIILGGIFVHRRRRNLAATAPLSSMESRSS